MRRLCLLLAIVLSGSPTAIGIQQTATPDTLPPALRDHLRDERLQLVTSLRGLPLGVRDALQTLFGGYSLDIAEPGAEFQGNGAAAKPNVPTRRLIAAGCSIDHCLVYYERGGNTPTWLVALFHWTPTATRLEWGGQTRGDLKTIEAVHKAALSGTIKGPVKTW
jgi:hypothetical protein